MEKQTEECSYAKKILLLLALIGLSIFLFIVILIKYLGNLIFSGAYIDTNDMYIRFLVIPILIAVIALAIFYKLSKKENKLKQKEQTVSIPENNIAKNGYQMI